MLASNNYLQVKILEYWHKVEFFVPYDMDDILDRDNARYQLRQSELDKGDVVLPWLSETALISASGSVHKRYRYNLYLCLFDKSDLSRVCRERFVDPLDEIEAIELLERTELEGKTCFAKLKLDEDGRADFETMSLSTLPWALAQLKSGNIVSVSYERYEKDIAILKEQLSLLDAHARTPHSPISDDSSKGVVTAAILMNLCQLLFRWSGYMPEDQPLVVIELIEIKKNKNIAANTLVDNSKPTSLVASVEKIENSTEIHADSETEESVDDDLSLDILNSFYIEDIERVVQHLKADNVCDVLQRYLFGSDTSKRLDLYTSLGQRHIVQQLIPDTINHGRWPDKDQNIMSLMQQFAISSSFNRIKDGGMYSVNGPPGTGKTTMLRDMVAENMVNRARVLVKLKRPSDAFSGTRSISFGTEQKTIQLLDASLTGFEMVVASSNNTAIENVSKELPLQKELGEVYRDSQYLKPVISKILAYHKDDQIYPLSDDEQAWGLISAALGNSKNRSRFRERLFFAPEGKENSRKRVEKGEYLTIWEWADQYNGLSYDQACLEFQEADKSLKAHVQRLMSFAELYMELSTITEVEYCYDEYMAYKQQETDHKALEDELECADTKCNTLLDERKDLEEQATLLAKLKPGIFDYLTFRLSKISDYKSQYKSLIKEQLQAAKDLSIAKKEKAKLDIKLENSKKVLAAAEQSYNKRKNEYANKVRRFSALQDSLGTLPLPPLDSSLEMESVQLASFWQNEILNQLRSRLFIAGMQLHEAWLAAVLNKKSRTGFSQNIIAISKVLEGKKTTDEKDMLPIWQSFFLWCPVVSSTFASIARQFRGIGTGDIGWLFIDEAGQAVPQAAVGAIWRAKRVLVVGDPLQIEPVFTVPPTLVEYLAKDAFYYAYEKWCPTLKSVQNLADNANPLGTEIELTGQQTEWIGSPLRVHRRCMNPMFSIANEIAYNNKMFYAGGSDKKMKLTSLGESAWYHIEGPTVDKQYVEEQGAFILRMFVCLYIDNGGLPEIYIISPFRRVKQRIQQLIKEIHLWDGELSKGLMPPNAKELKRWCRERVGTVHTFQGKEESVVFFVLGADSESEGSANWAASKPNLLNVAVTRAKHRVYIVGDRNLWSRKSYFSFAARELVTVVPALKGKVVH